MINTEEEEITGFESLDDDLFKGGKEKKKQTRSEKREERYRREKLIVETIQRWTYQQWR